MNNYPTGVSDMTPHAPWSQTRGFTRRGFDVEIEYDDLEDLVLGSDPSLLGFDDAAPNVTFEARRVIAARFGPQCIASFTCDVDEGEALRFRGAHWDKLTERERSIFAHEIQKRVSP